MKIIYDKPLPLETYGEDYPAQEFTIEWKYQGTRPITSYYNVIVKDGHYILMMHIMGSESGKIDDVKAIFRTINLEQ
jgi:hypothetical protein